MIGIISDVHGNYPALCAVMEEMDKYNVKKIISLGDVSGYYCMINECIDLMRIRGIKNILGNHDYYIVKNKTCPRSKSANILLNYQREVITGINFKWITDSYDILDFDRISLRHGGWSNRLDEYVYDFDFSKIDPTKYKIYASGHTHMQKYESLRDIVYFNPGSVGQPRDNDPRAAFAIIDNDLSVQLKRVKYDIDSICDAMKALEFPRWTYECLYRGTRIGG